MEFKLENINKEYKQLTDQYIIINKNINLALRILEENKVQQNKSVQNCDYIKKEVDILYKRIESSSAKKEVIRSVDNLKELDQGAVKIKILYDARCRMCGE